MPWSKVRVLQSEPWPYHLKVRILPFQGIYTGSNPVRVTMLKVDDTNFDTEVYNSDKPVLVAFLAKWCWVCNMYRPELVQLSSLLGEQVKFCEVDIDESPELKKYFGIESAPRSVLFCDGREVDQLKAAWPKQKVAEFIEKAIGKKLVQSP